MVDIERKPSADFKALNHDGLLSMYICKVCTAAVLAFLPCDRAHSGGYTQYWAGQDRQIRTGRTGQAEQDRLKSTGRTGQAEQDRQNRTGRKVQAEQDRHNRNGRIGHADQD